MAGLGVHIYNISKSYGSVRAVDDVSLTVETGEFLSLVGPSGCGKTTILRMLAGFVEPDGGRIVIGGEDVVGKPPYRRSAGMVFQNYSLFPHMTVADNVAFGLKMHNVPKGDIGDRVAESLRLVQLQGFEERYPHQLSGGQQQRVAIARVLAIRPSVLLLDEPFSALDRKLREEMQIELKLLQRQVGITMIFVTHDQAEALAMSDRIAVMNGGKIEQVGTPVEVYERPRTHFVARFLGTSNVFSGVLKEASGGVGRIETATGRSIAVGIDDGVRVEAGDELQVLVRPEKIRLDAAGGAEGKAGEGAAEGAGGGGRMNRFPGMIRNIVYQGQMTHYYVAWDEGEDLQVSEPNQALVAGGKAWDPGEAVTVTWAAEDSYVLADSVGATV